MIQFSEAQITHVEIHGLTCQMVDTSLKLIPSRSEKAIFQNEELYQYFKNPSKKYQRVLVDYRPPISVQTPGRPNVLRMGSLPATHIKIKLHGGKGSREGQPAKPISYKGIKVYGIVEPLDEKDFEEKPAEVERTMFDVPSAASLDVRAKIHPEYQQRKIRDDRVTTLREVIGSDRTKRLVYW